MFAKSTYTKNRKGATASTDNGAGTSKSNAKSNANKPPTRRSMTEDGLAALKVTLLAIQAGAEAIPIVGNPFKATTGIALAILDKIDVSPPPLPPPSPLPPLSSFLHRPSSIVLTSLCPNGMLMMTVVWCRKLGRGERLVSRLRIGLLRWFFLLRKRLKSLVMVLAIRFLTRSLRRWNNFNCESPLLILVSDRDRDRDRDRETD